MKIAFFVDTFFPQVNGVVTSVVGMAEELERQGHKVLIFAPKDDGCNFDKTFSKFPNIQFCLITSFDLTRLYPDQKFALTNLKIVKIFKDFNPDVVHIHTPFSLGTQGLLLAKRYHIPLVTTYHTNFTDKELLKALSGSNSLVWESIQKGLGHMLKMFLNYHQVVVAPTQDSLEEIEKLNLNAKSVVLPSPVDVESLQKARKVGLSLRKKMKLGKTMIYVGRLSGEKNIDQVIKILSLVNRDLPGVKLILIGDGPARKKLIKLSSELGVDSQVVWMGKKTHLELVKKGLYYLGDVFVTMSCFETQGLSTLEAMACGLPVVAANERGNKYLVDQNGFLVEKDDVEQAAKKVLEILSDKNLNNRLSKQSKTLAEKYRSKLVVKKLVEVYQEL